MPTVELILPTLYSEQIEIREHPARFKVACCGRRFGKDVLGVDAAVEPALEGYPVGWFSPTYKMMIEVWRELVDTLFSVIARVSVQERRIELLTKGVIELWSLDQPNSARGR